jgi:uncharacterized membrane protein
MKTLRAPVIILALLYVCFVASVFLSAPQLPERVATHFGGSGQPNGWMSRSSHLLFTGIFGFAFPLFAVAIGFLLRFAPGYTFNIPRRDYWLAPERRSETNAYLLRHSLWFACMAVCFVFGVHLLIVQANSQTQVQLSTPLILGLAGSFIAGIAVWVISMIRHFMRANHSLQT